MYVCIQLIDGDYAPEQPVTPAENDATDEVLVDNVQPSSPAGGDHFTDDEVLAITCSYVYYVIGHILVKHYHHNCIWIMCIATVHS